MKETRAVSAAIVLGAALFGAAVGAFVVGTVLSFMGNPDGAMYGSIVGAIISGVAALLQMRGTSHTNGSDGSKSSDGA